MDATADGVSVWLGDNSGTVEAVDTRAPEGKPTQVTPRGLGGAVPVAMIPTPVRCAPSFAALWHGLCTVKSGYKHMVRCP